MSIRNFQAVSYRVCAITSLLLSFPHKILYKIHSSQQYFFCEVDSLIFWVEEEVEELKEKDKETEEIWVTFAYDLLI